MTTKELQAQNTEARPYGGPYACPTSETWLDYKDGHYICPTCGWAWTEDGELA